LGGFSPAAANRWMMSDSVGFTLSDPGESMVSLWAIH